MQGPDDSEKLQNDLNLLQEWEEKWDMEFNPSKCQVLHITRSCRPIRYNYTMHGQTLDSVEKARYLGVDISLDLSFSHHIDRITTNAQKNLGFLKRNITRIPRKASSHLLGQKSQEPQSERGY